MNSANIEVVVSQPSTGGRGETGLYGEYSGSTPSSSPGLLLAPKRASLTSDSPSPSSLLRRLQPRPSSPSPFFTASPIVSPQPLFGTSPRRVSANLHHANIQLQPSFRFSPQSQIGMSPLPYITHQASSPLEDAPTSTCVKAEPASPSPSDSGSIFLFQQRVKYERTESAPAIVQTNPKLHIEGVPFEDVLALKGFLASIDIKHFGFRRDTADSLSDSSEGGMHGRSILGKLSQQSGGLPTNSGIPLSPTLQSPQPIRIRVSREKVRSYALTSTSSDDQYEEEPRLTPSKRVKSATVTSSTTSGGSYDQLHGLLSPISSPYGSSSRPQTPPKSPYRGKHSPNPQCASCGTTKTPYWRDAWGNGTMLCNACGLRHAKFKRRCLTCNYVPRKEDKGGRTCPQCNGAWSQ